MNLKDLRTRRALIAFGASAAVVAGGITVGISVASAAQTLTLLPTATSITTLNWGAQAVIDTPAAAAPNTAFSMQANAAADASAQRVANATFGFRVTYTTAPTGPAPGP